MSLWYGTIVEVYAGGFCAVTIPQLMGPEVMGPVPHVPATVSIGDRVLVATVDGDHTNLIVLTLAREPLPAPGPGLFTRVTIEDEPTMDTDAATVAWVRAQLPPPTP